MKVSLDSSQKSQLEDFMRFVQGYLDELDDETKAAFFMEFVQKNNLEMKRLLKKFKGKK
ncbi:MAG: hypothetical protein ACTSQY_11380 [Candidatus Odinarchaeia archaeon]